MRWLLNALYLFMLVLLSPWLVWRAVKTGRYRRGLAAKLLGRIACRAEDVGAGRNGPVVWFHGVSVGEIHLLVTLVAAYRKRHPATRCVISSTTDTGLAEARAKFPDCSVIAWPFDFSWAVANAIDSVNPDLIVLAEAELWPNFLAAAARRKIPVVVVNARLSPRSFGRYRRFAGLARRLLLRHVRVIGAQSSEYAERFRALGVRDVRVTGSVKYDGAVGDRDTPKGRELARLLNVPQLLVAGSTHAPEEAIVLGVFLHLRERFPNVHLLLVPRHPDRFAEVAKLVEETGLPFVRRSAVREPLACPPAVILLDSVGELGAAWGLAELGYVGGTLDGKRGGQSMIEPAGYGVPTVFGPHVWNFRDAAGRLVDAGGATMVHDASELSPAIEALLADDAKRAAMGAAARQLVREQQGATARTLDLLDEVLGGAVQARAA
jgi:3-deoxy-D-manno-octulosonic-acid transferase